MTTPYEATDRNCTECGEPVEDYTGHLEASEVTLCEDCYDKHYEDKWKIRVDMAHKVPKVTQ